MEIATYTKDYSTKIGSNQASEHRMLYDRKQAARQLSISIRSLDYLIAGKKFDTRRIGKKVLVTHASLVRFSAANHFDSPKEMAAAA